LVGFVGRQRELSRLLEAVAADTWPVLIVGDAGIGKSRLLALRRLKARCKHR
jgi:predicted ATP-dependent serine protease